MAGQHVQTGTLAGMDYDSGKVEVDFEGVVFIRQLLKAAAIG